MARGCFSHRCASEALSGKQRALLQSRAASDGSHFMKQRTLPPPRFIAPQMYCLRDDEELRRPRRRAASASSCVRVSAARHAASLRRMPRRGAQRHAVLPKLEFPLHFARSSCGVLCSRLCAAGKKRPRPCDRAPCFVAAQHTQSCSAAALRSRPLSPASAPAEMRRPRVLLVLTHIRTDLRSAEPCFVATPPEHARADAPGMPCASGRRLRLRRVGSSSACHAAATALHRASPVSRIRR
jgi:hypothetical protein